jgi:hypothetical protein
MTVRSMLLRVAGAGEHSSAAAAAAAAAGSSSSSHGSNDAAATGVHSAAAAGSSGSSGTSSSKVIEVMDLTGDTDSGAYLYYITLFIACTELLTSVASYYYESALWCALHT